MLYVVHRTVAVRSVKCASSSSRRGRTTAPPSTRHSCCSLYGVSSSWRHRTPDQSSYTAGSRFIHRVSKNCAKLFLL